MADTVKSKRSKVKTGLTPLQWEAAKESIRDLYITRNLTLKAVVAEMEEVHEFKATERMFKKRLDSWGMWKNALEPDWRAVAMLLWLHRRAGLPECEYLIHNKIRTPVDYRRYLKEQELGESDFLKEAIAAKTRIPSHIYCVKFHNLEELSQVQDIDTAQLSDPPFRTLAFPSEDSASRGFDSGQDYQGSMSTSQLVPASSLSHGSSGKSVGGLAGEYLHLDVSESVHPVSDMAQAPPVNFLLGRTIEKTCNPASYLKLPEQGHLPNQDQINDSGLPGMSDNSQGKRRKLTHSDSPVQYPNMLLTKSINRESLLPRTNIDEGFATIRDPYRDQDNAARFQAGCMAAYMYAALGQYDVFSLCLVQSTSSFRDMCISNDPLLLLAVDTMLVWFKVYAEGSFPGSILKAAYRTAMDVFLPNNPICLLLEWMTFAASGELLTCQIQSATLRDVCDSIIKVYGVAHGHAIVAAYCLGFQLLLEKSAREAEIHFEPLHQTATRTLGPKALQSINILAGLSRARSRQNKHEAALDTINQSLEGTPPGSGHPHRFELMYRKALICKKLGLTDEMIHCYCAVVEGQSATLGPNHRATQKAYDSLVKALQENGMWESHKDMAHRLLREPQADVTDEEASWALRC